MDESPHSNRRWRPNALGWALILVHPFAVAAYLARPEFWPWYLTAIVAAHLVITIMGLLPRSKGLGPNITRLPTRAGASGQIAITIDDGPDPLVTPQVLDILARHDAKATFFFIGERAQACPELVARVIDEGHAVENHTQFHRHTFAFMGFGGMLREISAAQRNLTDVAGRVPQFFRAPAGIRNIFLQPVLSRLGLQLASWTRRGFDTQSTDAERVLQRLLAGLNAGDILLLHDGNAAIDAATGKPIVLQVLPALLTQIEQRGMRTVTLSETMA